jgi:hypothetical protein
MILIQESKNLQEQERNKEDVLRRETQRISTLCLNMLIQGVTKNQMMLIMRMWAQISLIHLRINRIQISSNLNNRSSNRIFLRDSRMYQDQANSSKYLLHSPPVPDPTQEALNRLMGMLRQYPHYAQAIDPITGNLIYPRLVPTPMRPMDVAQEHALDYTTPQTIKFYNKGIEKLAGDPFDGTPLSTWLIKVQDKALMMAWTRILTIDDKLLTTNFSDISLDRLRAHAQLIQEEGGRAAQNSTMLLTSLKASITNAVYTKVYLLKKTYIIPLIRQPRDLKIEDGLCFLKVGIDAYHSNTRSSTVTVRKHTAHLDTYMRDVAKGDVSKLCAHTISLLYEVNAAGETTMDLITNLLTAMQKAPDTNFQRWLSNQIDLWSVRKKDWKEDGSDLMEETELYYKEAKSYGTWGKKASNADTMYAFQAIRDEDPEYQAQMDRDTKQIAMMHTPTFDNISEVTTLTAQLKQFNENNKWDRGHTIATRDEDSKYKWKSKAPKDGESTSKMVLSDGKRKKYHWCEYHKLWTIHSPKECKKQPTGKQDVSIRWEKKEVPLV